MIKLQTTGYPQFVEDAGDVLLDGVFSNFEKISDVFVSHLCLTIAETTLSSLGVNPNFRFFTSSRLSLQVGRRVGTASVPAQHAPLITVRMLSISS